MKKLLLILLATTLFSCDNEVETKEVTKPKILVLGNSITIHPPVGEWTGNWGMAASSPDKDFCNLVKKSTNAEILDRKSMYFWEANNDYNFQEIIPPTTNYYDYIIIKVGENVGNSRREGFKQRLRDLCEYCENFSSKIIIVSTVWAEYVQDENGIYTQEHQKDLMMKELCEERNYIFVDVSQMINQNQYFAWEEYQDSGIGCHPNDLGMEFIANKIIQEIQ